MVVQRLKPLLGLFPRGSRLPDDAWVFRHRMIVLFAVVASAAISVFSVFQQMPLQYALLQGAVPAAMALIAWKAPCGRRFSASLTSAALMVVAAMAVHISGTIEAHFLFFILVPVVALYEDWAPLATASLLVLAHHGLVGMNEPAQVYNHPAALDAPLAWSLIHSALFLAICGTSIVHWTIHERAREEENSLLRRLASQALHDPLTGLANRTLLNDRLMQAQQASQRTHEPLMLLAVDVDGFKPVNDSYGHAAGDTVLIEIARRLGACIRAGDTAARIGGDEFTLLLLGTSEADAPAMAERILAAVSAPLELSGLNLQLSVSVGVAFGREGSSPEQLLQQADQAMYTAKHNGRGRYVIYDRTLAPDAVGTLAVRPDHALAWASYTQSLRTEIAAAKEAGRIPEQSRGPETVRRTLESLVAAVDLLPPGTRQTGLPLPERTALEEFVFHHDMVQHWADVLLAQGTLSTRRPPEATRFWEQLRQTVTGDDGGHDAGRQPAGSNAPPA